MNIHDYDAHYQVFVSAHDRIVKQISEKVFEVYHITILGNERILTVKTIDLTDLTEAEINHTLHTAGLKYDQVTETIVNVQNPTEHIDVEEELMDYLLADRLSISGDHYHIIRYDFDSAKELNELLLEHDVPYRFKEHEIKNL